MVKQCHKLLEVLILNIHSAGELLCFVNIISCIGISYYFENMSLNVFLSFLLLSLFSSQPIFIFILYFVYILCRSNYRVSSSSPSSTPTDACATSSEQEDEPPPPPISARPERTKSIVSNNDYC